MFTCFYWHVCSWFDNSGTATLSKSALISMASIRKALHGGNKNQLKSPTVKRSPSSSVILQGWLFKQGSDGLMLWKRRWFVLADYCLFYYKSPAEEKLLGSFLLASYKISPCTSEDKIYRKFSFKAEHVNMRTYYFSAENQTSMIQWINALSLASICQENRSDHLETGKIESWVAPDHQPLYVNTPLKSRQVVVPPNLPPKRVLPENVNVDDPSYIQYSIRGHPSLSHPITSNSPYPQLGQFKGPYNQVPLRNNNVPITYDQRPSGYSGSRNPSTDNYGKRGHVANYEKDNFQVKKFPPRPHSADFLEHDYKESKLGLNPTEATESNDAAKLKRPKSSLDVIRCNDYGYDSLHWSEEAYAEKMRQTSLYVTPQFRGHDINSTLTTSGSNDAISFRGTDRQLHTQPIKETRYELSHNNGIKFSRSASARCASQSKGENNLYTNYEGNSVNKIKKIVNEKDIKSSDEHEESMRRLLVWKQRMLQSPLTRKVSSGSARQSLIPSRMDNNPIQKKNLYNDENKDHMVPLSSGNSLNNTSSSENYSEKMQCRKKSFPKENQKYHSLSSDDDELSVEMNREGRIHSYKTLYNKKSALNPYLNSVSPLNLDSSEGGSGIRRNSNGAFMNSFNEISGPSRVEPQPSVYERKNCDYVIDMHDTDSTSSIPSLINREKKCIDSSCENVQSQSSTSNKPSDSGYSTLQDGIVLRKANDLNLNQNNANYSFDSNDELDNQGSKKEWRLKLDESRVIKEFSYHYINTKNDDSLQPLWLGDERNELVENFHSIENSNRGNEDNEPEKSNFFQQPTFTNVFSVNNIALNDACSDNYSGSIQEGSSGVNDPRNSAIIKENLLSKVDLEVTASPSFDKYYSDSVGGGSINNIGIVSEVSKEKLFSRSNSRITVSSDDDRDDEVTATLGNHEKVTCDPQCLNSDHQTSNCGCGETLESELLGFTHSRVLTPECGEEKIKEEHYMPMTPKKKVPSPDNESAYVSRNISVSSFYPAENNENVLEESSYVEMSHNSTSSSNNGIRILKPNGEGSVTPCSSDLQLFEENPDYEYISKDHSEPVYVELSSSFREIKKDSLDNCFKNDVKLGKDGIDQLYYSSLKHSLPDILNTSNPQCSRNSTKSDSSDADDEASKDLECITTPTHPRFSLSDTFRPASYYLGANHSGNAFIGGLNLEQQDSSDSDLVSPPPIPLTSPPVDELGLSLDLVKTCTLTSKEAKEHYLSNPSCKYWKILPEAEKDHKLIKLTNKYLSRPMEDLSSETDSNDSFKKEQLLKRRPVSADILDNLSESNFLSSSPSSRRKSIGSDIESVSFSNTEDRSVNYDNNSEDLQVNDQFLESLIKNNTENVSNLLNINPSSEKQSSIDSRFKINNMIWEYENKNNELEPEIANVYKKYCNCKVIPSIPISSTSVQNESIPVNIQSGAPYYYSDILKSGGPNQSVGTFEAENSSHLLNNHKQRKSKSNVNTFDCSERDNNSKHLSSNNIPDTMRGEFNNSVNKNINTPNLTSAHHKSVSVKLFSRSLTPDFYSTKHSSSLMGKESKSSKNITLLRDTPDSNSIRRVRSFEGLLDSADNSEGKPRVLRASPSNAIFKLLQTTKGKSQETIEEAVYPLGTFLPPDHGVSPSVQTSDPYYKQVKGSQSLRVRSLDNLKNPDRPVIRKSFVDAHAIRSSPHSNDFPQDDLQNSCDGLIIDSRDNHIGMSRSPNLYDLHLIQEFERPTHTLTQTSSNSSLLRSHFNTNEIKHEKFTWEHHSNNLNDKVRSSEDKLLCSSHLPPALNSTGESLSSNSFHQTLNTTSNTTTITGDTWNLELSAGELLGRTHEELVLLLIQLRRRSSGLCKAIDDFQKEISSKVRTIEQDPTKKLEGSSKNEELKKQLMDLEKQYEKGKPLVNLVDNMVKLGSLYHNNNNSRTGSVPQRMEFNHKVQEQRLLVEEKKEWERLPPDQKQLQEKVKQLYKLDQILKKESNTLQHLQQDKALLEQALVGLRQKLDTMHGNPVETEQCRHQQRMLEKGLSRVRSVLAHNSKKLEETVAENARLEQELVILKQKLQFSRKSVEPGSTTVALESELKRVQDLVGNLQRQRQYLCSQVWQLTEKSNSLSQQIEPLTFDSAGSSSGSPKRKVNTCWMETDLDSQITQDVGIETHLLHQNMSGQPHMCDTNKKTCIIHKEKSQEIKTVRIVKRESERRQRDRERNGTLGIPLTNIISRRETIVEESSGSSSSNETTGCQTLQDNYGMTPEDVWNPPQMGSNPPPPLNPRTDSVNAVKNFVNKHRQIKEDVLLCKSPVENNQTENHPSPDDGAPIYLSIAAQEIVQEVAWRKKGEKRLIPKEKRRYHTVSGQSLFQEFSNFSSVASRDDLDMERALRNRLHTPDVVRSTLSRDAKFTAETIDTILGMPSKIVIPERYKPEVEPQVSKEELLQRSRKAEAIRKMLTQSCTITPEPSDAQRNISLNSAQYKYKIAEEKQQREHLLQLNQILALQVTEKSKIVAGGQSSIS